MISSLEAQVYTEFYHYKIGDWIKAKIQSAPDRFARTFVTITLWFCLEIRENPKRLLPSKPERLNQRTTLNVMPPTQLSCETQSHVFSSQPRNMTRTRAVFVTCRLHSFWWLWSSSCSAGFLLALKRYTTYAILLRNPESCLQIPTYATSYRTRAVYVTHRLHCLPNNDKKGTSATVLQSSRSTARSLT